jgi:hypothetical protein
MFKITELWAFVALASDGDEAIMGEYSVQHQGWVPFIGADLERFEYLKPKAERISKTHNVPYKILKFKLVEEITCG